MDISSGEPLVVCLRNFDLFNPRIIYFHHMRTLCNNNFRVNRIGHVDVYRHSFIEPNLSHKIFVSNIS